MTVKPIYTALIGAILALIGSAGLLSQDIQSLSSWGFIVSIVAIICISLSLLGNFWAATSAVALSLIGAALPVIRLSYFNQQGEWGYWMMLWGFLITCIFSVGRISLSESDANEKNYLKRIRNALPPASVPFILMLLWQGLVAGFNVPKGIFPGLDNVYTQLSSSLYVLLIDSYVTFVKEVFFGLSIGVIAGFLVGTAISYSKFLQNGFLPLAAAFGAVPIVGLAPVLGRAFGVDWESKAAVVVIVTFFPVVLNTVQGLTQVDPIKLELLKAYAAKPRQVFFSLRLPNALPFIFNALKLASVLAVISVIVAEFLIPGPPRGLGQRISLSARQGAFDTVFAAIFVSSIISITIYQALAWLEARVTAWHPSFRDDAH